MLYAWDSKKRNCQVKFGNLCSCQVRSHTPDERLMIPLMNSSCRADYWILLAQYWLFRQLHLSPHLLPRIPQSNALQHQYWWCNNQKLNTNQFPTLISYFCNPCMISQYAMMTVGAQWPNTLYWNLERPSIYLHTCMSCIWNIMMMVPWKLWKFLYIYILVPCLHNFFSTILYCAHVQHSPGPWMPTFTYQLATARVLRILMMSMIIWWHSWSSSISDFEMIVTWSTIIRITRVWSYSKAYMQMLVNLPNISVTFLHGSPRTSFAWSSPDTCKGLWRTAWRPVL